jgi:2-C-methyl-D-erythritol 4-phosphate cytidylyltransferase
MQAKYWAVVPAAGVGRRMGEAIPKQYLSLSGKKILDHTLTRLLSHPLITRVYLALSNEDHHWSECEHAHDPRVIRVPGGKERCHSVLNALHILADHASEDDWVLVHDAARPCLSKEDLNHLIDALRQHPIGGIMGVALSDTIKQVNEDGCIESTLPRERLWRALTPQMFRLAMLKNALESAINSKCYVTDEAGAMELAGYQPLMIEGDAGNIKITRPEDLKLATFYL